MAPTPTPIPISAPLDIPLALPPEVAELVTATEAVAVVGETVSDTENVVDTETKRLRSEDWTSIFMGCAHIVTGPVTCVLISLSRSVTMIELDDGKLLRQPASVHVPSA